MSIPTVTALALVAQIVSPSEADKLDGNTFATLPLSSSSLRYQQIDGGLIGNVFQISELSFRADGDRLYFHNATGPDRAITFTLQFADGSGQVSPTFSSNYLSNPTYVLGSQQTTVTLKLPTWVGRGDAGPSGFDVRIPFPNSPWLYGGNGPLLWEMAVFGNTSQAPQHADGVRQTVSSIVMDDVGPGCLGVNGRMTMTGGQFENHGPNSNLGFLLRVGMVDGPPSTLAGVIFGDDTDPPPPPPPPPCLPPSATLFPRPLIFLPLPNTDATGFSMQQFLIPYRNNAIGVVLRAQSYALDLNQPFGVRLGSSGKFTVPTDSLPPTAAAVTSQHPFNQQGTVTLGSAAVVEFR